MSFSSRFLPLPLQALFGLPWENLPVLAGQQVTRVPSLPILHLLLRFHGDERSVVRRGVGRENVFYLVDPENNLTNTLDAFKDRFAR